MPAMYDFNTDLSFYFLYRYVTWRRLLHFNHFILLVKSNVTVIDSAGSGNYLLVKAEERTNKHYVTVVANLRHKQMRSFVF